MGGAYSKRRFAVWRFACLNLISMIPPETRDSLIASFGDYGCMIEHYRLDNKTTVVLIVLSVREDKTRKEYFLWRFPCLNLTSMILPETRVSLDRRF